MENIGTETGTAGSLESGAWLQQHLEARPAPLRQGSAENRRAPGWFDSSWELQRGLDVREGLPDGIEMTQWLTARPES